jgi:hypothetical protein
MAWVTPKTDYLTGDLVTAQEMNDIGNDLSWLKDLAVVEYTLDEGSDYTTTSTTFVDVDATNLALTITTDGGDVLVHFHGVCQANYTNRVDFDVELDGTRLGGDDGIAAMQERTEVTVSFTRLITGLSAGEHTFKLQWKASDSNGATLYAGAGTANLDLHPQFWVREVA